MSELHLEENQLLFGADPTVGIVAAELAGGFIRCFTRTARGVFFRDDPFHPFILLESPDLLAGFQGGHSIIPLQDRNAFCFMAHFKDWQTCLNARKFLARTSHKPPSAADAPYVFLNDPVHQHLLLTGKTLFKGLPFDGLHRLALDIETLSSSIVFPNAERPDDRIISIAVAGSNGYSQVLSGHDMAEAEMIERLGQIIRKFDPDVLEGHNLFRFDLEYIRIRGARFGIKLRWGRDGSEPRVQNSRFTVAEKIIDYPRWNIYGRHVIDTYFLLQLYDVGSRELENHSLKTAARHFGLARPHRVYLQGDDITRVYHEAPERLLQYNLDDAHETLALSRHLSHPYFLQTRMFPFSYQTCVVRGNATKINALFLREYLRCGKSIPRPQKGGEFEGGYTDLFMQGVVGPVVHCDVASLYPSILISYGLQPANDTLGLFLPLLKDLRTFRLHAKKMARVEADPEQRDYFSALQQSFKILINSFYGYLGTGLHHFSDASVAAEVTSHGRAIIRNMLQWLQMQGALPVETDTDGIYFIPPPAINTPEKEEHLVKELSDNLPPGIEVELDGRFRAMFSYKVKNYALLDYDGTMIIKGSGLKSRGMEKYLREFLREMIRLLLLADGEKVESLYNDYLQRLRTHAFPISWLAKTETLSESSDTYREKVRLGRRNPSAAHEIAAQAMQQYRAGTQITFYISGTDKGVAAYQHCKPLNAFNPAHPDENCAFYSEKLRLLKKKFVRFLPQERTLFG